MQAELSIDGWASMDNCSPRPADGDAKLPKKLGAASEMTRASMVTSAVFRMRRDGSGAAVRGATFGAAPTTRQQMSATVLLNPFQKWVRDPRERRL